MVGGCWWWLMVVGCDVGQMLWFSFSSSSSWYWREGEREFDKARERREKKKIIYKATVTRHICMVTVSILHTCKVMQSFTSTDAGYFMLYRANFCTFCILHPLVWMLLVYVWFQIKKSVYFTIQLIFATIHGSYCTFWYYLWVSLYYFN